VIFRRRPAPDDEAAEQLTSTDEPAADRPSAERPTGPWDRSETTADADDGSYLDLGGLVIKSGPELELRLQVEEQTSAVAAVMLAGPESGLELRAFAAPRSAGIWDDVRADIAAEAQRRGGTASESVGEFGTEIVVIVPVKTPDGRSASQPSRIVGVEGPRWLLRGTFLGRSALEPDPEGLIETAFRSVIVVRGDGPMAPREMIPLRMPPQVNAAASQAAGS
jgi:hypothetical protein